MDSTHAPKPPKISVLRNLPYAWRKLLQLEGPSYFFLLFFSVICQVAAPLLAIILPSTVIRLYQSGAAWQEMVLTISCQALALSLFQLGKTYCQNRVEHIPFLFRLDLLPEYLVRNVTRDYQLAESPAGQAGMAMAERTILWGNDYGIEAFLIAAGTAMYQLCGFLVYLLISAQLNIGILLVLLTSTVGIALLNGWKRKASTAYVADVIPLDDQRSRLEKQILDGKYAKDIHLYQMKTWLLGTIDGIRGLRAARSHKYAQKLFAAFLGQQLLVLVRDGLVYGYLLHEMVLGVMPVADFILFTGVASGISSWLSGFTEQLLELQSNGDLLSHYRLYMDELPRKSKAGSTANTPIPNPGTVHTLQLEHVSFQYPESQDYALKDISLTLKPGEKLALVGANGAGKSTLVKLLCGLYHPTQGRILLDGVDISTMDPNAYFREFSVVFQDVFAFAFPLSSNVACQPQAEIRQDRLTQSLKLAGLEPTVANLPKGADTTLLRTLDPEGVELSGGQMQKLMLARALYKDAPMVILDEPTAALDPLAEGEMYSQYNRLTQGKTSVFISHRLSSTRFCDRVIFLEDGAITETGTHDSLLAQGGGYARMFEVQSHYYQKGESSHD